MTKQSLSKKTMFNYALLGLVSSAVLFPEIASAAAGAALPWEGPLELISQSLAGPVAKFVCLIVVVVTGLMMSFGEGGGASRKMLQIVFGLAIALGGAGVLSSLFTPTAGILF